MSMTAEKPSTPKSVAGNRAAIYKPKKEAKPKAVLPDFDSLAALPEDQYLKLTNVLKDARNAGERIRSSHGKITKDVRNLFDACLVRVRGDQALLKEVSLSEAMVMIYRTAENIDEVFGKGTFKETKAATGGGASTWRKPWSRIKQDVFGDTLAKKTPIERFQESCNAVVNCGDVKYANALAALNRAYGVK